MNDQPKNSVDFPAILASSVHDIKNSLATVRELIANLAAKQQSSKSHDFLQLEFEANRMNNSLVQLLELYKIQADKFSLIIDQESVMEILQEVQIQQDPLLRLNKINMTIECSDDLYCFCDYNQISNALSSILNNAQRYSHKQIRLSAYEEDEYIVFCMEDDGDGYPPHLLTTDFNAPKVIINQVSGSTGLGLQFVSTIAALHKTQDRQGYIKIDNDSELGGARFRLFLP
jgi:K+-sensing histidine kinase KdpD